MLISEPLHILQNWLFCYIFLLGLQASVRIQTVQSFDWTAYLCLGRGREECLESIYEAIGISVSWLFVILDRLEFHDGGLGEFIGPLFDFYSFAFHAGNCLDSNIIIKIKKQFTQPAKFKCILAIL